MDADLVRALNDDERQRKRWTEELRVRAPLEWSRNYRAVSGMGEKNVKAGVWLAIDDDESKALNMYAFVKEQLQRAAEASSFKLVVKSTALFAKAKTPVSGAPPSPGAPVNYVRTSSDKAKGGCPRVEFVCSASKSALNGMERRAKSTLPPTQSFAANRAERGEPESAAASSANLNQLPSARRNLNQLPPARQASCSRRL